MMNNEELGTTESRPRRKVRRVPSDPIARVQKYLDNVAKNTYKPPDVRLGIGPPMYWYVYGVTKLGREVCLGPYMDVQSANDTLNTLMDGELKQLPTRDLHRATRIFKAELLDRTKNADESLKRLGHKLKDEDKVPKWKKRK